MGGPRPSTIVPDTVVASSALASPISGNSPATARMMMMIRPMVRCLRMLTPPQQLPCQEKTETGTMELCLTHAANDTRDIAEEGLGQVIWQRCPYQVINTCAFFSSARDPQGNGKVKNCTPDLGGLWGLGCAILEEPCQGQ